MVSRKSPLRVAQLGDKPPLPKATNLKEAVDRSERELLVMMRSHIASEIDSGVPPHTLAPLTRQLRDLDKEIRLLDLKALQEADDDAEVPDEEWHAESV